MVFAMYGEIIVNQVVCEQVWVCSIRKWTKFEHVIKLGDELELRLYSKLNQMN